MNPYSGFRDKARKDSIRVLETVRKNVENSIKARGLKPEHYYRWMKDQGIPFVQMSKLKKYPPNGLNGTVVDTDHLIVISLSAVYMGIPLEEAMSRVYTVEQHKIRQ